MYKDYFLLIPYRGKKKFSSLPEKMEIGMAREKNILLKLVLIYITLYMPGNHILKCPDIYRMILTETHVLICMDLSFTKYILQPSRNLWFKESFHKLRSIWLS